MAYLELSREAYDDLIRAAGNRAASVSSVCNKQGVWSDEAKDEAPEQAVEEQAEQAETQTDLPGLSDD